MQEVQKEYETFLKKWAKICAIGRVQGFLNWDQEVMMPKSGADQRAEEQKYLAEIEHVLLADGDLYQSLAELAQAADEGVLDGSQGRNVHLAHWAVMRAQRIPTELAGTIAELESKGLAAWEQAREQNDFCSVAPILRRMVEAKREYAKFLGDGEPYAALLADYEPDLSVGEISDILRQIRTDLSPIAQRLFAEPQQPDYSLMRVPYDPERLHQFCLEVVSAMGYDFSRGRVDVFAGHPMTVGSGNDVRWTTRYAKEEGLEAIHTSIHETGHALYEQGIPEAFRNMPCGTIHSLSIHESQSRFWEVVIGKSLQFWQHFFPKLQSCVPALADQRPKEFFAALNAVQRTPIRLKADALTYNLHIIVRFEIERALVNGDINIEDLPALWNERYARILGITPAHDREGVLQDVHWYYGLFGYFPTYALGNCFAAQFHEAMLEAMPYLYDDVAAGRLGGIREWLRTRVHQFGSHYSTQELLLQATGKSMDPGALIRFLKARQSMAYGIVL